MRPFDHGRRLGVFAHTLVGEQAGEHEKAWRPSACNKRLALLDRRLGIVGGIDARACDVGDPGAARQAAELREVAGIVPVLKKDGLGAGEGTAGRKRQTTAQKPRAWALCNARKDASQARHQGQDAADPGKPRAQAPKNDGLPGIGHQAVDRLGARDAAHAQQIGEVGKGPDAVAIDRNIDEADAERTDAGAVLLRHLCEGDANAHLATGGTQHGNERQTKGDQRGAITAEQHNDGPGRARWVNASGCGAAHVAKRTGRPRGGPATSPSRMTT